MVPNWARFFVNEADRSCEDPEATVADRLGWAKLSTKIHKAGNIHCTQLTLPFFVTTEKLNDVQDLTSGWSRQSRGASVNALQSVLEGHQLLPSDPRYGGSIKMGNVGVYSFPCVNDPFTRAVYSVAEETFGDGIW
eukprot:9476450-Pyramimonas_sp.AAC.1